jgi:hypothetical protein
MPACPSCLGQLASVDSTTPLCVPIGFSRLGVGGLPGARRERPSLPNRSHSLVRLSGAAILIEISVRA